ncbi:hypothetical protein BGZ51_001883 [Haplosporangium sp. Z 767]|nr:hypothetical protein BGZ51_001883 [Haplosporangium sp. Z 767]
MSTADPARRTERESVLAEAQAGTGGAVKLNERVNDQSLSTSMNSIQDTTPSQIPRVLRDPAYIRKREEALRATGETLYQRCTTKMERLHQLRLDLAKKQPTPTKSAVTIEEKQLEILKLEEARLQYEYQKLQSNREIYPEVLPEVTKLRVRQMVQDSIRDFGIMIPHLKKELADTQTELASEKRLLKELQEIKRALQARRDDLARLIETGSSQESNQGRQKLLEARRQVQELMKELTTFLTRHCPPIQPDDDDPREFELKIILEDIMNLSVSQPSDPYLVLVPGEYYPPHVEQLINAGVAVRHPRDSQRLRLVDFFS